MANDAVGKLRKLQEQARVAFDDSGMARPEATQPSALQHSLHFWGMVARSFVRNRCPVRASALAYASLLAMVPMLAVAISVSAGLLKSQGENQIADFIDGLVNRLTPETAPAPSAVPPPAGRSNTAAVPDRDGTGAANAAQPGAAGRWGSGGRLLNPEEYARRRQEMAIQIKEFIGNVRSGSLGVTGIVALLFVAITMLSRIEKTFNDIWGVTRGRTWFARVVQYWGAITLGPLLLAVTAALTSGPYFEATKRLVADLGSVGAVAVNLGMRLLPFVIWSLAFASFYYLMPNTKVRWRAALVGGIFAGCLWQLNSQFSVLYISRVVTNSKIYGSLGMVPVLMIGLYFAWIILLLGAQVAYAYQNRRAYLQEKQAEGVNQRSREFVGLRLMTVIAACFQRGDPPPTLTALSDEVGVPSRLASQLLQRLIAARLVVEVVDSDAAFIPARPVDQITAHQVLQAIRAGQGLELATRGGATRELVRDEFERIGAAERAAANAITLQGMVEKLDQIGAPAQA